MLERLFSEVVPRIARNDHPRAFAFVPGCGRGRGRSPISSPARSTWTRARGCSRRADRARARGARLVQGVDRLPGHRVRDPHERRVGGQHDRARVRARARRRDVGRPRRLRARPDACVGLGRPDARLPPASGARAADRRALPIRARPARGGDRRRPGPAGVRCSCAANAGSTSTGSVDPLDGLADRVRERGIWLHVDGAYGVRGARRARPPGFSPVSSSPTRSRSIRAQVASPAVRVRLPARPRRSPTCGEAFEVTPDYLKDTTDSREVNLYDYGLQPTLGAGAEGVALGALTSGSTPSAQPVDRAHRPRGARRARIASAPRSTSLAALARRRLLPAAPRPARRARAGRPGAPSLNAAINASGTGLRRRAFGGSTRFASAFSTTPRRRHVDAVLDVLERAGARTRQPTTAHPTPGRELAVRESRLPAGHITPTSCSRACRSRLARRRRTRRDRRDRPRARVASGETVVEQWDSSATSTSCSTGSSRSSTARRGSPSCDRPATTSARSPRSIGARASATRELATVVARAATGFWSSPFAHWTGSGCGSPRSSRGSARRRTSASARG